MSHDVLSRAFLRAAAPRVSSKAAADNNWQATGQRSQPFWLRKPAFLSFLEAETDSTFFPRKCSKYGVLISDQLKRVSYLFTEKQKHGYDERINVVNEEKNKFFVFLGRRVLVPVFSNDEFYIYIYTSTIGARSEKNQCGRSVAIGWPMHRHFQVQRRFEEGGLQNERVDWKGKGGINKARVIEHMLSGWHGCLRQEADVSGWFINRPSLPRLFFSSGRKIETLWNLNCFSRLVSFEAKKRNSAVVVARLLAAVWHLNVSEASWDQFQDFKCILSIPPLSSVPSLEGNEMIISRKKTY